MMKVNFFLLLIAAFFSACDKQDDPTKSKYDKGVFVVNEGPFGGTGTITWHDPATGTTEQDIYGKANGGAVLGELVQSLTFHDGKGYICIGNGSKIVVVNAATFEFIDTIGGLAKPRYLLPYGDHFALVTQWGADGNTGTVAKVDLKTNEVVQISPVIGAGPEKIFQFNADLVLIPNSGGYSIDSTVVAFRLSTFSEETRSVTNGSNPGMCAQLTGNNTGGIYALCKGSFLESTPRSSLGPADGSGIAVAIPFYSDDLCAAPGNSALYFTGGGVIYEFKNGALRTVVQQVAYGLTCHPGTGELYCTDAKDFSSAGEAVIYKPDGTKVGGFPTGIGPGEIVIVQ